MTSILPTVVSERWNTVCFVQVPGATLLPVPRILPGLIGVHVTAVSCGAGHTVVCARDGRVFSW